MGQVHTEFTSDTKRIEAAQDKMLSQMMKLTEANQKLAALSKQGHKETTSAVEGGVQKLQTMAAGMLSVNALVNVGTRAWGEYKTILDATAAASIKLNQSLVKTLAFTGDIASGAKIEAAFALSKTSTREQSAAAFAGVTGAAPSLALDKRLALTEQIGRVSAMGLDPKTFGETVGGFAEAAPSLSAADVLDLSLKATQEAGADQSKLKDPTFLRGAAVLTQAGLPADQAISLGIQTLTSEISPKFIEAMGVALQSDVAEFRGKSAGDRLALLGSDNRLAREVLGEKGAAEFALIDQAAVQQRAAGFRGAMSGDFAGDQMTQLGTFEAGSEALMKQQQDARHDRAVRRVEDQEKLFLRQDAWFEAQVLETDMPWPVAFAGRRMLGAGQAAQRATGNQDPGYAMDFMGIAPPAEIQEFRDREKAAAKMVDIQERQLQALERIEQGMNGGGPAPIVQPATE